MCFKCKKILGVILALTFVFTMLPADIFAATYIDENYATSSTDLFGWAVDIAPTHSVLEKTSSGIQIRQTTHTYYAADGTSKNTATDGRFKKTFTVPVASDSSKGMDISYGKLSGKVKLTFDYVINQGEESDYESIGSFVYKKGNGNGYYNVNIDGYVYLRLYNDKISVSNAPSIANSTMSVDELTTSNGKGESKQLVVEIDTDADTVSVSLDGGTVSTGPAVRSLAGQTPKGYVDIMSITNMQRMNVDAYLKFTSIKVEKDEDAPVFDADTLAKIEGFKNINVTDANNVETNITIPNHVSGLTWKTSNENVMTKAGKITRSSSSDPTTVVISTTFNGKTTSGETVPLNVSYTLNVTGISTGFDVTDTINPTPGATDTTEKWYTMPERGNEEDGYPMPGDPDYISDEVFFGKWNSATSTWTYEPYFRYSDYSDMTKVEAAAKAGDYETAKAELLAYYKSLATSRISSVNSINDSNKQAYKALYELMSRNAYVTNFISNFVIDTFSVTKEWSDVEINVKNRLNEAKGSYDIFTLVVASVDKYRNQAEVYSRESNYDPVIVATVNGEEKTFYPTKDATLQGGAYSSKNNGSGTVLYAEEAGSWADPEDRTKRMFIGFDISGIKRTDTITDAKIVLRARHTGTDDEKLMAAYWIGESSWLENTICWDTFADHMYFSCNDMYCWDWVTSNVTTIKGKVCGYHRDTEPATLASSYSYYVQHPELESYPEKYAYTYLRQYLGLINSIGLAPEVMNQLDMSTHITGVSQDVLRLMNSKYMTPEVFTAYMKHLWMLTDYHVYNYFGKTDNNWATFSTGAVYNMCARFPEFAQHDAWTNLTKAENDRVMLGLTFEDGMCLELSHNYHTTLLSTFATPFTTHNKTGEPLPYSEDAEEVIHNIVLSLFNQSGPYLGGFNMGDGYDPYTSYVATFKTWYNNLFSDDPIIAYRATNGEEGELPVNPTTNYVTGMRTVMRSDWTQDALALAMTNKMVGSHGHKDALSIAMFAYGKYLLTDQGYGSVQTGNTMYYMKSPQQHNMVTVNDSIDYLENGVVVDAVRNGSYNTLQDVDGEQKMFDSNKQYDFVEYTTPAYRATTNSQRSVTFLKNQKFWIVTDYHVPSDTSATNEFTQHWHLYPGAEMTIDPTTKVVESHFENEPNVMIVPVDPSSINKMEIRGTWYSEKGGQINNSEKGMLYKSKTGNGVFSTIIMPTDVGEDYTITPTKLTNSLSDENVNLFSFTVKNNVTGKQSNFWYYHVNEDSMQTTVNVGDYSTDANTLVVEEDAKGNIVSIYMVDGTFVSKDSTTLVKTADGTKDSVAFTIDDDEIDIHTSDFSVDVLDNLQFSSSLAKYVKYEKTTYIAYKVVDGMMVFKDVTEGDALHTNPAAGRMIFDSANNPELVEINTNTKDGYYQVTNNFASGGGLKIENLKGDPAGTGADRVAIISLDGIIDDDEENRTKSVSSLMVGKYAIEMEIQQNITTERSNPTYATLFFGKAHQNTDGSLNGKIANPSLELRLYTNQVNAIRYADTQADGTRRDKNKLAGQILKANTKWKLRIAVDTVNRTSTIFVNDVVADGTVEFPHSIKSTETFLPDIWLSMMPASSAGAYVQINNIKIYKLESYETDSRIIQQNALLNTLPSKLSTGNPYAVYSNLVVPTLNNVTWSVTDNDYMSLDGILKSKVSSNTPITFTASSTLTDTVTTKIFTVNKLYDMLLVPGEWRLSATSSGNKVTASVTSANGDYSLEPSLVIAGYNSKGFMCDKKIVSVTDKLENYSYTLNNETETIKVFLISKSSMPVVQNIILDK